MYWPFSFLKRGTPQNLVLAPGASIRINTVLVDACNMPQDIYLAVLAELSAQLC